MRRETRLTSSGLASPLTSLVSRLTPLLPASPTHQPPFRPEDFSLVRIGERSGMGISSLYGAWKQEKFAQPSIAESYEPDRTKVTVEYESEAAEVGVETPEAKEKTAEVGVETSEVGVEIADANNVEAPEFDILMGAYRNDFRENARRVLAALAKNPEMDFGQVSKAVNISENSVWRAVRALREIGLLVREGANKGGRWIVKQAGKWARIMSYVISSWSRWKCPRVRPRATCRDAWRRAARSNKTITRRPATVRRLRMPVTEPVMPPRPRFPAYDTSTDRRARP